MEPDATRPITETRTVVYRCPCGNRLTLDLNQGGVCDQCQRSISPKSLAFDKSSTVEWDELNFDLAVTQPGRFEFDEARPQVVLEDHDEGEDPELLIGKKFGHFEIIAPIGRGGMGQVYRALDTSLQRYVAVKVLRSGIASADENFASSDDEIDKLLQEAISQARVPHPNIVTIYYVGKDQGNPFLAMELVNGQTLNQRISDENLTFKETVHIGLMLARALRASFDLDIIHGDIKPSNVLIAKDGTAKLSDFGMARSASEKRGVAEGGTPNYLAPELLTGEATSVQSDMYALGVTLFEMTFRELPLVMKGNQVKAWIETHETKAVEFPKPWPPDIPELWRDVLSKLLAKRAEDRYDNYDQLLQDLERLQPQPNVTARFFPRLIAAGVDWVTVLLVTIGFQTALITIENVEASLLGIPMNQIWAISIGLLTFLPIMGYSLVVYHWRHSIGRSLMHLRVANQYGLRPSGMQMAWRSVLRMQFPWIVILMTLLIGTPWAVVGYIGYITGGLFLLFDIIYMLISANGSSLHDWFAGTRVVLDTDENR